MKRRNRAAVFLAIGGMLAASPTADAAGPTDAKPSANKPHRVEAISGSPLKKITLTEKAAQRLDIKTVEVRQDSAGRKILPYSAIIYHKDGSSWVYTTVEPLTYVRQKVAVDGVEGNDAMVKEGPAVGVKVVATGVAELYGAEMGVGH
jgi:hypothetical protein